MRVATSQKLHLYLNIYLLLKRKFGLRLSLCKKKAYQSKAVVRIGF